MECLGPTHGPHVVWEFFQEAIAIAFKNYWEFLLLTRKVLVPRVDSWVLFWVGAIWMLFRLLQGRCLVPAVLVGCCFGDLLESASGP